MSDTPGEIKWAGRPLGADNAQVYGELGYTAEQLDALQKAGII